MQANPPKLFVLATPIGHKEDITLRALSVMRQVNIYFAEDTRETKKLFSMYDISISGKKFFSFSSHNMKKSCGLALTFLQHGDSIALTTDRGTPAISDPGALLVEAARGEGYSVVPVPGASALTALMSVAGEKEPQFLFLGFLPSGTKEKNLLWKILKETPWGFVFFESPNRIQKIMEEIKEQFREGRVFLGREMTKQFETFEEHDLSTLNPESLDERGEYCVYVKPAPKPKEITFSLETAIAQRLLSDKEWSKVLSQETGISSKIAYDALQKKKSSLA